MSGFKFSMGGNKRDASGKVAFGLKPAPKLAPAFADDSDDDEPQQHKKPRADPPAASVARASGGSRDGAPAPPADPEVRKCAERLAEFVAKNGRSVEDVTRQRNPGNTPFRFLFDTKSPEYRYYEHKIQQHQRGAVAPSSSSAPAASSAAAAASTVGLLKKQELAKEAGVKTVLQAGDSVAAMEAFARMAEKNAELLQAQQEEEDRKRQELLNETSFDRRRVVAVYKDDGSRGHHMQDFIPKEELTKLLSKTNDEASRAHAAALEEQNKIGADNVGHRLLQKMGWKEGQGLGAQGTGMAAPVSASGQGRDTAGLGAIKAGDIQEEDDVYTAYRKRMQLGYKHRPNPLGNPRKAYY